MLWTRVLTALIGIPLLLFFVYLGGYVYGSLVTGLALLGLREFFLLVEKAGWTPVKLPGYLFLPVMFGALLLGNHFLVLLLWVSLFLVFTLLPVFYPGRFTYWGTAASFWGLVYLGVLPAYLLLIRSLEAGLYLTVFLLALIWITDIMAFFVGRSLGKRPLAKQISPNKTVEGTMGGIAGSLVAGVLLGAILPVPSLTWLGGGLLGLLIGGAGTLGDLAQSALKRSVHVKDTGSFLPGHGGMLDRFDSLLFAAPVFYYCFYFLPF